MSTDLTAIPLSRWADDELGAIGRLAGHATVDDLTGSMLLGERAGLNGFRVPGRVSAGGGCRLWDTATVPVALNLARAEDRSLLPALFQDADVEGAEDERLALAFAKADASTLVAHGRVLGMAIALLDEVEPGSAARTTATGIARPAGSNRLLVVDLSALWAGPLAAHLLQRAGAEVVKVESPDRADTMRHGDAALFARLNGGKRSVVLDLARPEQHEALCRLIARADVVIEAARPRAMENFGIFADEVVGQVPGLVWLTITGHGSLGEAAGWVGFGDDCGVAGGLSAALLRASGSIGFVGDAIADPLAGIHAAHCALEQRASGVGARIVLSMSGVVATAIAAERAWDPVAFDGVLQGWALGVDGWFPPAPSRAAAPVAAFGADTDWLAALC